MEMSKYFQGVPNVEDKNKDKTVKSVHDAQEASHKWTRKESSTQNNKLGFHDYKIPKK